MAQTLRVHASNGGTSGRRLQHPNKVPATNTEQTNYPFKFASAAGDFFPDPYTRENGSSSTLGSQNQGILDDLEDFIQGSERQTNNNNKGNSLPNKMATSNSSGTNQPTANANGFQMSMNSTAGLSNKTGTVGLGLPSSVHLNNQLPSILDPGSVGANSAVSTRNLSQSNPNPANMKLLAANQPALSPQNQFNQYNTRQEMLLRGFRDVPIAPREPTVSEQYGSQQRFMSASSENQLRGLNPQTSSPYPHNYYPQESHTSQSGQRVANSQTDERNMITNQHFQWQNRLQTANHCSPNVPTNTSPGPSMSRTQIQQPGIPQRQSPYMMVGSPQQQQQQSQSVAQQQQQQPQQPYAAYIMQGGMKAAPLQQTQQYYGNMSMGRQVMGQASLPGQAQAMANQMQKPPQDYASFQQQQMQQRYSQQQYAQQMPYMTQQQRQPQQQQPFPQAPAGMPRMPSSHPQPILPKPASADMYAAAAGVRYASTSVVDSAPSQEFPPSRMPDQQLHQAQGHPPTSASYGNSPMARIAASPEMMARYASNPGAYQRSNAPPFPAPARHARHTASPNITVGSPLRSVADGSPSVGVPNYSTDGPTSSSNMPSLYPPSKLPPPFGMTTAQIPVPGVTTSSLPPVSGGGTVLSTANSSVLGPAAAAAAAVLEAATSGSRFSGPAQSTGQVYVGSQDMMLNSKAPDSSPMASAQAPIVSASGMPSLQLGAMIGNVQTGRVPSPTLNELPTAEDVEAMIESMRAGESSLPAEDKEQPASQGSAPPSVGSLSASGTVAPSPSSNQPSQPQGPPIDAANNSTESHQLNNSALDMHAIDKNRSQLSPPASPLSTFSGLSPGVSPSGVSLTSSFGDEEVNLDEINPSLPSYPALSSYQFQSRTSQQQYEKFSRLYELSDEPERKEFLDKYQAFMSSQGAQIVQVPVFMRQPLDLFKFFTVVRERGGLQEVVRKKLWQGILQALNLPTDLPNVVHVLRNQYARYLLSYEEKCSKTNLIGDMMKNNLLEASGIPPPNATVTCSEVIIPTSSLTQSQRPADTNSLHASYSTMTSEPPASLPSTYNLKDSFSEGSQYDASKLISNYRESSSSNFPMNPPAPSSSSFGTPQFPYSGERRSSLPNHPHGGYPPYMMAQRNLYPGATSLSQLFQQSNQQSGHPAANYQHSQHSQRSSPSMIGSLSSPRPMMPSPSSQEKMHPLWGSQYSPSTEPEHMFDYPPGAHSGRIARSSAGPQTHFPPAPPYGSYPGRQQNQYSPSTPPYRPSASPSPSSRQPVAAPHQASSQKVKYPQPQMQQHQQAHASSIKRELPFPNDCVESTRPVFTKKRKLTSRDLGPVEAWRVMMSLKSGLLSEATWALDTLNILLYDDNTVAYFMLSQLPGLLDNLIDHFRRYLIEIFGTFVENEISVGSAVFVKQSDLFVKPTDDESPPSDNEENSERIEKINRDAKNSFSAVVVGSTFSFPREGFQSGSSDWLMGGGDTTRHIQTHLGTLTDCDKTMERQCENKELEDKESVHSNAACEHCQGEQDNDKTKLSEIKPAKWGILCKDARCSSGSKCDVNWTKLNNESSCSPVSEEAETEVDAAVKKEDSKLEACEIKIKLNSTQNDVCDVKKSKEDQFTARLKQELDLDLDSDGEDSESDSYLQSEAVRKINVKPESIIEEQSCGKEDAPLCLRTECQDAVSRRCLCVSNILRGLSFVPGNDAEMSRHAGLLLIVGRLLMLHHKHAKRVPYRHSYLQDDIEVECPSNDRDDWWWHCLEGLRENAFVITANVAGQLDLSLYPEAISLPLLDGLLHWFVCQSAAAQDPMPTATPGTSLSPRQLVLEALAKMSILESNVDMILTTPPLTRVDKLYAMLVRLVGERGNPVTRELALVLLSNLAQGENSFVGLSDSKACISMLLEFIEDAATSMSAYASGSALAQAGFHSENFCGTSVDMLRRAASTLVCLARIRSNRALFLPYQGRILRVATLRVLDSMITNHLAEILFYLSR